MDSFYVQDAANFLRVANFRTLNETAPAYVQVISPQNKVVFLLLVTTHQALPFLNFVVRQKHLEAAGATQAVCITELKMVKSNLHIKLTNVCRMSPHFSAHSEHFGKVLPRTRIHCVHE